MTANNRFKNLYSDTKCWKLWLSICGNGNNTNDEEQQVDASKFCKINILNNKMTKIEILRSRNNS